MKRARSIALVAGVALFVWILSRLDLQAVWTQLRVIHWRLVWVVLIYGVALALNTQAWRSALEPLMRKRVGWWVLFRVRLAGQALNVLTPAAPIAGEPFKVLALTRFGIPIADATASVVIAKTTFAAGMLAFCGIGVGVTLATESLPSALSRGLWVAVPALCIALGLFFLLQFLQPFHRGFRLFRRFIPETFERIAPTLREWDATLRDVYLRRPGSVVWSFCVHLAGWMAGAVEVYVLMSLLGAPVSWSTALSIEGISVLLKSGGVVIPGALGVSEGALLLACVSLGVPAVTGLAAGLIRRFRELLWLGLGLLEVARTSRLQRPTGHGSFCPEPD